MARYSTASKIPPQTSRNNTPVYGVRFSYEADPGSTIGSVAARKLFEKEIERDSIKFDPHAEEIFRCDCHLCIDERKKIR